MGQATLDVSEGENGKPEAFVFIHDLRMIRECVGGRLREILPSRIVEAIARPEDITEVANVFTISLIIAWIPRSGRAADAILALKALVPGGPVVVISDLADSDEVRSAFRAGVRGYLLSSMGVAEIASAIQFVSAGGTYVPASVLSGLTAVPPVTPNAAHEGPDFSLRQMDVLRRLQDGKPNKIIAYELGMAEATVKVHIRAIMRKLNARNRT